MSFYVWETRHKEGENDVGKVKLIKAQADAIEELKSKEVISVDSFINAHARDDVWESMNYRALNRMKVSDLARALYEGYEVKEEYKIGDWVVHVDEGIGVILEIENNVITVDVESPLCFGMYINTVPMYYRHATPEEIKAEKERRLWKTIDREVGEFRDGDIGITNGGAESKIYHRNNIKAIYKDGGLKGFYPAESFIPFGGDSD